MPPKKKSGKGKKKGKKSGKKSGRGTPKFTGEPVNEMTKEFFMVQIKDLENRLARYQHKCDELEVANGQFNEKFVQNETEKRDVIAFWKRQVESKTDEIADLNDRYIGLQQTRDNEREQYELQIQQQRNEYQEMKDQLTSENMILGGKLASLEEFKVQKEDLMAKLKKEMILRVNQVAAEFRKVSNKQMAETTKRTIRENVSINAQLAKMSDKTMELIQENDELKAKEKKQKQQIELLEANEKELAKKNHSSQKIIRMLTEKCRNQEEAIADLELRDQEHQEVEAEAELLRQQVNSTREDIQQLNKENEALEDALEKTRKSLEQTMANKCKLEEILSQAAGALRGALTRTAPEGEEELSDVERRDHMLEQLLNILNSAAAVGLGPDPAILGKQFNQTGAPPVRMPTSARAFRKGDMQMSPLAKGSTLPHYSLGDLGLIPRPKHNIPTFLEATQNLSATTRLGGLRKVLTRSVAVQTVSAPKALFYADQLLSRAPPGTQETVLRDTNQSNTGYMQPSPPLGPITTKKLLTSTAH
ncbi:hypothetical protein BaRGS_00004361 [Batillaria attramentaria]|uniref:Cilia- and flagella-associated protein 157 n=1 Tax=Batillaria attramentaria TaxID=370345 RepID=A0ABD0LZ51_9CAEN